MKLLLTGAHFTPAQAVIEEFKKKPGIEIIYVGRNTTLEGDPSLSIESQVLPKLGVKFIPIMAGRLQRSFTIYTIPALLKIPIGLLQAFYVIWSEKPKVILSFGGYVAVPQVLAGWLFSIPIIVHEQTFTFGLANKISALFADKVALSFNEPRSGGTILTGNPLRDEVLNPQKYSLTSEYQKIFSIAKKEKLPVILITCGNQGAHVINLAVEKCLSKLIQVSCVIHVTGDNKFGDFERLGELGRFGGFGEKYLVKKWIGEKYGNVLSKVDMVICRAGVNTLTELAYMGKPALVIPIPYLYQDEQNKNAKYFANLCLVRILPQSKLSGKSLLENIKSMFENLDGLTEKAKSAKSVIIPDAAKRLALETILLTWS